MPIVKVVKRDSPFAMIDARCLQDERLSWKAKGIVAYLLSKPDDWQVILADLVNRSLDGARAVRAGLQELRRAGYAHFGAHRDASGRLLGTQWTIFEAPRAVAADIAVLPMSAKRDARETPTSAKEHATKIDSSTKKDTHAGGLLTRLFALFERPEGKLSKREQRAWNCIKAGISSDDVHLIERFHRKCREAQRPPYPRQELSTLLENFAGELDKARRLFKPRALAKAPTSSPTNQVSDQDRADQAKQITALRKAMR